MAGARVGMTFAHKEIINFLNQIKAPYNLNTLSQKVIINKINKQNKVLSKIKITLEERKILEIKMRKIYFINLMQILF